MRLMTNLIAGVAAIAIAAVATQANATTIVYTTNSQAAANPAPNINSWYFTGSGSLSYADGLADGIYNQSILTSFNQTNTFWLSLINPPNFQLAAATWNFGLADLNSFSLQILNGIPVQAAFTLGPKTPTTAISNFATSPFSYSFDSHNDPNPTASFLIGTLDRGIHLTGNLNGTVVPEPSTWALMMVGFGMIGYALRRNQSQTVRLNFA